MFFTTLSLSLRASLICIWETTNTKTIGGGNHGSFFARRRLLLRQRRRRRRWYAPTGLISHESEPGVVAVLGGRLVGRGEVGPGGDGEGRTTEVHAAHPARGVGRQENLERKKFVNVRSQKQQWQKIVKFYDFKNILFLLFLK